MPRAVAVRARGHDVPTAVPATFAASNKVLSRAAKSRIAGPVGSGSREFVRLSQPHRDRAVEAAAMLALEGLTTEGLDS
jgi:hypothetical protein